MARNLILAALLAALVVFPAGAGTITRSSGGGKTAGTDWSTGDTLNAADLNSDFNTIYSEFNGSIAASNIASGAVGSDEIAAGAVADADVSASAAIAVSKLDQTAGQLDADIVDDYSASDSEYLTATAPGDSGTTSKPTNLEEELARIRYALKRLGVGTDTKLTNGTSSAGWIDAVRRGDNLLHNPSFEVYTGAANSAPDGWSLVGTPTTVEQAETAAANGEGKEIHFVAQATSTEGITQTIGGMKPSTFYLIGVRVKAASGSDTCILDTNNAAAGTFADLTISTSSTTYTTLAGIIKTDATPTAVAVRLLSDSNAQADDCDWDHAFAYEAGSDVLASNAGVACYDESDTDFVVTPASGYETITGISCAVTIPAAGYAIFVDAVVGLGTSCEGTFDLYENGSTAGVTRFALNGGSNYQHVPFHYYKRIDSGSVGSTFTYTLAVDSGGSCNGLTEGVNTNGTSTSLRVEARPM